MPTEPRPGAPSTVNLGTSAIEAMFGSFPHGWLAQIIPLINPMTIPTDELCAVLPDPPENWTIADWFMGTQTETHDLIIAKIERMARAGIWNTYCHEVKPAEDQSITGPLHWLGEDFSGSVPVNGDPWFDFGMIHPEADLWVVTMQCTQNPTTGSNPVLGVTNGAGDEIDLKTVEGFSEFFGLTIGVFNRSTQFRTLDDLAFAVMPEDATVWRLYQGGTDGVWSLSITSYSIPAPPPVEWPAAPADPTANQFTAECVANLCTVGSEWTAHRIAGAIVPGQLTELNLDLENAKGEILDALASRDLYGAPPVEPVTEPGSFTGSNVIAVPSGMIGVGIYVSIPDYVKRMGTEPEAFFECGHVAQGLDNGWHASEALKHSPQILLPFKSNTTRLALDLEAGVSCSLFWLRTA